jgi:hypothetical protein
LPPLLYLPKFLKIEVAFPGFGEHMLYLDKFTVKCDLRRDKIRRYFGMGMNLLIWRERDEKHKRDCFFTLKGTFEIQTNVYIYNEVGDPIHIVGDEEYIFKTICYPQNTENEESTENEDMYKEYQIGETELALTKDDKELNKIIEYDSTLPLIIADLNITYETESNETEKKFLLDFMNKYDMPDFGDNYVEDNWYNKEGQKIVGFYPLVAFKKRLLSIKNAVSYWRVVVGDKTGETDCDTKKLVDMIAKEINSFPLSVNIKANMPTEDSWHTKPLFRYELAANDVFSYAWNVILKNLSLPPGKRTWRYKQCDTCGKWEDISKPLHRNTWKYCYECRKKREHEQARERKRKQRKQDNSK